MLRRCCGAPAAPCPATGNGKLPADDIPIFCTWLPALYHRFLLEAAPGDPDVPGMRLWSLHPRYLDRQGLVALWREALLAQAVLSGGTKGYRRHPQLERFRAASVPLGAIAAYLRAVHAEAAARGYSFDAGRIRCGPWDGSIDVPRGQIAYEWQHLTAKLEARAPDWLGELGTPDPVMPHPLFRAVPGGIVGWERP